MFKFLLIATGFISFIIGGLIFLVGIGAIGGIIGGIIALLIGSMISLTSIGTMLFLTMDNKMEEYFDFGNIVELIKQNGKWQPRRG
ncbi:MAG: hypothetical protein HQK76_04775 [Desulfobacterales bacterium]|nr:hypothetical protein [Desulfobacterales bacterium]